MNTRGQVDWVLAAMLAIQVGMTIALAMPFILSIWAAFMHRQLAPAIAGVIPDRAAPVPAPMSSAPPSGPARFVAGLVNASVVMRAALEAVTPLAREHFVRIDLADAEETTLHADPNAVRMVLRETLLTAIRASPGGQVLITARALGPQLNIQITDDAADADQRTRVSLARGASELIALLGGSIAVEARPGRGTMVTIRLPIAVAVAENVDGTPDADAEVPEAGYKETTGTP